MSEREVVERSTAQVIADGLARQKALEGVDAVLGQVRGTATDNHQSVQVTVDGRGKLIELWLRQDAVRWGADQLGRLIVLVAEAAMDQATQAAYNRLAPLLGDGMTYAIEQLSGRPAPARRDGGGITAEEFMRRREERLRRADGSTSSRGQAADDDWDPDDPLAFDISSLRSDR
ncbi:YbaB/EbfC family nucleoid-associated protein [Actinokineospora sp. G85]|uniref:YbaB/EbfC family nucleoid-associated protein n=1 Tax=Actinokineospora sp. G85 TaxID=3406626 RepID=UPI003C748ED8